jgi:hypothetical protein
VFGIPFDRLDQVGDQVIPSPELDIHLSPGIIRPVPQRYQVVINSDSENNDRPDYDKNNYQASHLMSPSFLKILSIINIFGAEKSITSLNKKTLTLRPSTSNTFF